MERLLECYDKESMKMAILKHEETFREQVYELHRLYRIQKLLMNDLERKGLRRPSTSAQPDELNCETWETENYTRLSLSNYDYKEKRRSRPIIDLERPAEDYITDDGEETVLDIEQESDVELTLGGRFSRTKKNEASFASDSGPSFSSSSTDSTMMQKKRIETPKHMNTRELLTGHDWGLIQMPDMKSSFQSENQNSFIVEEQLRQDKLNQPSWLFHALSLNMT